ncbi:Preflagellin peptidase [uncultured archaeon]|nr:Preflagellin peptidase [uncultured archaeon]
MFEIVFLFVLGLIWIIFATVQDAKTREISNWLNFSLAIFAIGFRFFYSLFSSNWNFLFQGLIGLGIFFVLGNIFYYTRIFAGGDAKLLISLGAILPIFSSFTSNLTSFVFFLILFLFIGAFYGLVYSFFLVGKNFNNFRKNFSLSIKRNKTVILLFLLFAIILGVLGFISELFFYLGLLIFIMPYLFIYAKTLERSCLVKSISSNKLQEGDWLLKDVRIGRKIMKTSWEGLTLDQIKVLKKSNQKIKIKEGIPFAPVFLISFVLFFILFFTGILEIIFSFF